MKRLTSSEMKAVILAAGVGSRIGDITKGIPKGMIRVNGKYIYEIILDNISRVGISDVVFVVGYKRNIFVPKIKRTCKKLGLNVTFVVNERYKETNTLYSLWLARNHIMGNFVFIHGDLIFDPEMLKKFVNGNSENAILVDFKFPLDWNDAMKVIAHGDEIKYMSKSVSVNEMDGTAIGIYKFNKDGANKLLNIVEGLVKKKVQQSWVSEAINIMSKMTSIKIARNDNHLWADVDNLRDLEMANSIYANIVGK